MRPSTHKTLLVIADISGFTQFMKSHENAANHALQVVVELLKAVISAAAPPLKLAEVEGDAVFFYAICKEDGNITRELAAIKKQVMSFFGSFYQTLHRLCASYPCARNARDLRLKVVIHSGEVALEHIHGFDKLFGMDVILAHRLLKNSVPAQEYVLLTEAAYNWLGDFYELEPERKSEYYEGIGVVETVVIYPPAQPIQTARTQPTLLQNAHLNVSLRAERDNLFNKTQGSLYRLAPRNGIRQQAAPASWWVWLDEEFHTGAQYCLLGADLCEKAHDRFWAQPNGRFLSEPFHQSTRAQPVATVWIAQLQTKWRRDQALHVAGQSRQELRCGRSP